VTSTSRPGPMLGLFDQPYWRYAAHGELRLPRCVACGAFRYPPGPSCPDCLTTEHTWELLSGNGTLLAWTIFRRQYFPQFPVPHLVAAIRTDDGPILIGNLVGVAESELRHDMPLHAVFEDTTFDHPDLAVADTAIPAGGWRICQWAPVGHPAHLKERA
jgi:uncharacterized OB-fold protein